MGVNKKATLGWLWILNFLGSQCEAVSLQDSNGSQTEAIKTKTTAQVVHHFWFWFWVLVLGFGFGFGFGVWFWALVLVLGFGFGFGFWFWFWGAACSTVEEHGFSRASRRATDTAPEEARSRRRGRPEGAPAHPAERWP
jgi:hypothetical protein